MQWALLALAIVAEVIATSALKASDGFSRLWPTVVLVLGYGVSFYCLSIVLRTIPVGIVYAIWSGVGIALITDYDTGLEDDPSIEPVTMDAVFEFFERRKHTPKPRAA